MSLLAQLISDNSRSLENFTWGHCPSQPRLMKNSARRLSPFYSAAALHAMQSAVIPTAIPSVRLSDRLSHAGTLSRRMNIGLRGLHCEVANTL